jgi:glutamate 5-kinase
MFKKNSRIVFKVGSSLVVRHEDGQLKINDEWIKSLCDDITFLIKEGHEVALVCSGSIAFARQKRGITDQSGLSLYKKQVLSSTGQIALMNIFNKYFDNFDVGQILISRYDVHNGSGMLNLKSSIKEMFLEKIIPIINENDIVTTREIRIGNNDFLSSNIAKIIEADYLVIMSDIEGLYNSNPKSNPNAKFVNEVKEVNEDIIKMAGCSTSDFGTGGMITKIEAAQNATQYGVETYICSGEENNPIKKFMSGNKYTKFLTNCTKIEGRNKLISEYRYSLGKIELKSNIQNNTDINIMDIKSIEGDFKRGEIIDIIYNNSKAIGLTEYSSYDLNMILNKKDEFNIFKRSDIAVYADCLSLHNKTLPTNC